MDVLLAQLAHNVLIDSTQPFPITLLVGGTLIDGLLIKPLAWYNLQQESLEKALHCVTSSTSYIHLIEVRVQQGGMLADAPPMRLLGERVDAWSLGRDVLK